MPTPRTNVAENGLPQVTIIDISQNDSGTIQHALGAERAYRADAGPGEPEELTQLGIQVRSGLTPQPSRPAHTTEGNTMVALDRHQPSIPTTLSIDICGDERLEGPMYNYARVFTWRSFAVCLHGAFSKTVSHIKEDTTNDDWDTQSNLHPLRVNGPNVSRICGLQTDASHQILGYTENTSGVRRIIVIAFAVAISVKWITAGCAIAMAYLTPTVGLGCRSGGYTLYGVFGTIVLILMTASARLSHSAMKKYQSQYDIRTQSASGQQNGAFGQPNGAHMLQNLPSVQQNGTPVQPNATPVPKIGEHSQQGDDPSKSGSNNLSAHMFDDIRHSLVCFAAVSLRALGKCFAVSNTFFLILTSIFEYTGYYNNCWCKSCVANLGHYGWATIFKTDSDYRNVALGPWLGSIIGSTAFCFLFLFAFWVALKK
jgi:hypothetical protein